jgi:hypothetical protein
MAKFADRLQIRFIAPHAVNDFVPTHILKGLIERDKRVDVINGK